VGEGEERRGPGNYAQSQTEYRENFAKFALTAFTVLFYLKSNKCLLEKTWKIQKSAEKKTNHL
jgi:hypothetical protein